MTTNPMTTEMVSFLTSPGALLMLVALAQGEISEGQAATVMQVDRVTVREMLAEATQAGKATTETAMAKPIASGGTGTRAGGRGC